MTRLPLTVIGGYLGAGKTTLINRLLGADHGLKLAVLVNDFGAINIDAALLQTATNDTIELTNGCVCCTMSGDLFFAIGDLLDRMPRPDHIIVEASGIADPAKIAAVALAEKELRYAGIVTIVDGHNIAHHLGDQQIAAQVTGQVDAADLIAVSKADAAQIGPTLPLRDGTHWTSADDLATIMALIFDGNGPLTHPTPGRSGHPAYAHWSDPDPRALSRDDIDARLSLIPPGLLRFKGLLPDAAGGYWEIHVVGTQKERRKRDNAPALGLVAIGLRDALSPPDMRRWWQGTDRTS